VEQIGITKLNGMYPGEKKGLAVALLLDLGYIAQSPRIPGKRRSFDVIKPLPERAAFDALLRERYSCGIESAASDAYSEIRDLAAELSGWAGGMPANFQQAAKYAEVRSAADDLEELELPFDAPEALWGIELIVYPSQGDSRAERASWAAGILEDIASAIDNIADTENEEVAKYRDMIRADAKHVRGVRFPSMF